MIADNLSLTLAALADPTRRAIVARLARGEASVSELARPFDMTLPAVSKHLKVLERAGLITRGRDAQRRPCRLEAKRLKEVSDWLDSYRQFWEQSFDRLDAYLTKIQTDRAPARPTSERSTAAHKAKEKKRGRKK
jgi:DNA-binding transcriptional ArsR family regulator